jgi:Arm domain-containing DNA-binding protein
MLNDTKIRSTKPREKAFKLYDERGLFLLITPAGGGLWRFKYRLHGGEKLISLGRYPDVTLKRARDRREAARKLIADDVDPSAQRRTERAALAQSFRDVADEWLELQRKSLAPETISILGARLNSRLYPYLGSRPMRRSRPRRCS